MRNPSLRRLVILLAATAALAACGQTPGPGAPVTASAALSAAARKDAELVRMLERFTSQEGRKVTAHHVPLNDGRGAAELRVRLSPDDKALLVQLYRLHPRPIPAETFPDGLVARTVEHLAALHRYKLPKAARLEPGVLTGAIKTRRYIDGEQQTLAYESFYTGDGFMLFGKYDTQGRILKIDIETWQ